MVRKREDSPFWWYDFTLGGCRFRGSTETADLAQAKAIEAKLRTDALMQSHFPKRPEIALDPLLGRYWLEYARYLKWGGPAVRAHCRHILDHFGPGQLLHAIDDAGVSALKAKLRDQMSDSTINRVLSTLRKLINVATEEWGFEGPQVKIKKHMMREPESRTRWLTNDEAERLIACAAEHLQNPIRFALLTGVRLSNILHLKWEHVRFAQNEIEFRIKSNIPGGKLLVLPISDPLRLLLLGCGPRESGHVFLRHFKKADRPPEPIKKFRRSFATACSRAGITDFRFHDLRHTAATWMVQRGVPLDLVQEVLGHTDIATTKKYAHRSFEDKRQAMEKLTMARIRHGAHSRAPQYAPNPLNELAHPERLERPTLRFVGRAEDEEKLDDSET